MLFATTISKYAEEERRQGHQCPKIDVMPAKKELKGYDRPSKTLGLGLIAPWEVRLCWI